MNCIDRVFEEGNVPPGRGVPYTPLAWDLLFVPQPIELAAAPLPFPDPPSFAADDTPLAELCPGKRKYSQL